MLKINLLPPEKRKSRTTPILAFIPLTAGIALLTLALVGSVYLWVQTMSLENEIAQREKELGTLQTPVRDYDDVKHQIDDLALRSGKVQEVTRRPVDWSRAIRALLEVSGKNGKIWLDEITYLDGSKVQGTIKRFSPQATAFPAYGLQLRCNAGPDLVTLPDGKLVARQNPDYITKFRMDLKQHPDMNSMFEDVWPTNPEWRVARLEDSNEKEYLQFEVFLFAKKKP